MKIEVLGHWAGAPGAGGACSSYVVSTASTTVLLDCGPGTVPLLQQRSLIERLDAIVISHMHQDHILDLVPLADLHAVRSMGDHHSPAGTNRPNLFVPRDGGLATLAALARIWAMSGGDQGPRDEAERAYFSANRFTDAFAVEEYDQSDRLELGDLTLTFQRTQHAGACFAPRLTDGLKTIVYSADAGFEPGLVTHAAGADVLVCEAMFDQRHPLLTDQHGHMTPELAGRVAQEAGAKRLIMTHFVPGADRDAARVDQARDAFDGAIDLARTGLVVHA